MQPESVAWQEASEVTKDVLYLGGFAVWYADVERATRYPSRAESDVEHSYMLTLVALHLADSFYPHLDQAKIAQFCMIHDAPEAIVGDTPTFNISPEARVAKEAAESKAVTQLLAELPPYWARLLERYEEQVEPEARFVRLVDKV
ncbi:HD domain-containing protein, partial [Candidatus Saccharibacteria bacterium]|nr:HD domain-containing protein [Candidatus Saccharibacteria bacterium]